MFKKGAIPITKIRLKLSSHSHERTYLQINYIYIKLSSNGKALSIISHFKPEVPKVHTSVKKFLFQEIVNEQLICTTNLFELFLLYRYILKEKYSISWKTHSGNVCFKESKILTKFSTNWTNLITKCTKSTKVIRQFCTEEKNFRRRVIFYFFSQFNRPITYLTAVGIINDMK